MKTVKDWMNQIDEKVQELFRQNNRKTLYEHLVVCIIRI